MASKGYQDRKKRLAEKASATQADSTDQISDDQPRPRVAPVHRPPETATGERVAETETSPSHFADSPGVISSAKPATAPKSTETAPDHQLPGLAVSRKWSRLSPTTRWSLGGLGIFVLVVVFLVGIGLAAAGSGSDSTTSDASSPRPEDVAAFQNKMSDWLVPYPDESVLQNGEDVCDSLDSGTSVDDLIEQLSSTGTGADGHAWVEGSTLFLCNDDSDAYSDWAVRTGNGSALDP